MGIEKDDDEPLFKLARRVRETVERLYRRHKDAVNSELASQRLVFFALIAGAPAWATHEVLFRFQPEWVSARVAAGAGVFGLMMLLAFAWVCLASRRLGMTKRQFLARAYRVIDDDYAPEGMSLKEFGKNPKPYAHCAATEEITGILRSLDRSPPTELMPWLPGALGFAFAAGFSAAACLTASVLCRDIKQLSFQPEDLVLPVLAFIGLAFCFAASALGWSVGAGPARPRRGVGEKQQPRPTTDGVPPPEAKTDRRAKQRRKKVAPT